MISLDIIFSKILTITIPGLIKIDFQILIAMIAGYILGPLYAVISLIISDILGGIINSGSLGFFFGFAISSAFRGLIGGLFLYKKNLNIINTFFAIFFAYIVSDMILNTFWLSILSSVPFTPLLISRIIPRLIFFIFILVIYYPIINMISKNKEYFYNKM